MAECFMECCWRIITGVMVPLSTHPAGQRPPHPLPHQQPTLHLIALCHFLTCLLSNQLICRSFTLPLSGSDIGLPNLSSYWATLPDSHFLSCHSRVGWIQSTNTNSSTGGSWASPSRTTWLTESLFSVFQIKSGTFLLCWAVVAAATEGREAKGQVRDTCLITQHIIFITFMWTCFKLANQNLDFTGVFLFFVQLWLKKQLLPTIKTPLLQQPRSQQRYSRKQQAVSCHTVAEAAAAI